MVTVPCFFNSTGMAEQFSACQEIQLYLPTLFNLDNSIQSWSQQQQGGLQERQVADAQPKQARDSANSFRSRIAITALSVFKSLATLDVFIRQVFTAALESRINCSLRKSPYREQVTLVAQNSHQLPTSLGGKGEV